MTFSGEGILSTKTVKQGTTNTRNALSIEELKSFITWAHGQKIKSLKIDGVEVEFSELSFIPDSELKDLASGGSGTLAETEPFDQKEEEELLFASAR